MNVFKLRNDLVSEYSSYISSFITINDDRIRDYVEQELDEGEYVAFDVSSDGGTTWSEEARLEADVDDEDAWLNVSGKLTGISSLQLRFRASMSGAEEAASVDDVRVVASYH